MSRPRRIEFSGAVYHVTARGDRREPIFEDEHDRASLSTVLEQGLDGLDVFLRNEGQYATLTAPRPPPSPGRPYPQSPATGKKSSSGFDDVDDDIPF